MHGATYDLRLISFIMFRAIFPASFVLGFLFSYIVAMYLIIAQRNGIINTDGGRGGGSMSRDLYKTHNHKSQSFQLMISQITDNEFS